MLQPLPRMQNLLTLLLSGIGLFLSAWIIIPAPVLFLLPLGVGAPEVSPWLLGLNSVALFLSLPKLRQSRLQQVTLSASLVGLLLSALPLLQFPLAEHRAAIAMQEAFGENYIAHIPNDIQITMRPQPFVVADAFTGIGLDEVRHTTGINFANPDGVPLTMDVYQPLQVGKYPAVVVIYGGAWQTGNPGNYPDFNRYMAARGYTVFAIDYRHAPQYQFPAQLDDVETALSFIRQHAKAYEADPNHIALLGRSAGAHLATLAAYRAEASLVQAVVSYYGPVDLTAGYADPPSPDPLDIQAVLETFLGGSPAELPESYQVASPINYVTRPLPPTLLVHGNRDHVVKIKFARQMGDRLHSLNSPAALIEIPWAEHAFDSVFSGPSNQLALYYTERFIAWALKE